VNSVRVWPGLIAPPLVFLTLLCVNYGLEPWACEFQIRWPLHLASAVALVLVLVAGALAVRDWRRAGFESPDDSDAQAARVRFLSSMATMLSTLSALAVLGLWATILIMPPCVR
jgi:MFS superfamily sulfate permease-like transporter